MAPIYLNDEKNKDISQTDMVPLGEYLFLRITQANPKMKSIFGIPGDFNLNLLEYLYTKSVSSKLRYIGLCNELNAGYTVDGYAQGIGGLATIITTYGVGELSALNAIAGSFAEFSPILHIVGTTSSQQMEYAKDSRNSVKNYHHLVQNKNPLLAPNHDVYKPLVDPFTVANESLTYEGIESGENLEKIDKVLRAIIQESRPGYIFIPRDVPDLLVSKERLNTPLFSSQVDLDIEVLDNVCDKILKKLYNSNRPAIIGDALVKRFNFDESFNNFIKELPSNFVRLFSTNMSRFINEDLPNYVGVYFGKLSPSYELRHDLEDNTDVLINFGYHNVETNTGIYTFNLSKIKDYVEIHPDYIKMDNECIQIKDYTTGKRLFSLGDLLDTLSCKYDAARFINNNPSVNNISYKFKPKKWNIDPKKEIITQEKLIDFFNSYLQPNDFFVVETCTFLFAIADIKFPMGVQFISQNFFGSIGYALPATLGVALAAKDLGTQRRVILIQGDGSAQMTVQELSTYLRNEIENPKIFLLNNEGYTVERKIKGPTRSYNDIQSTWDWCSLFKVFGDTNGDKHTSVKLNNSVEFDRYFENSNTNEKIEFIELLLQKLDCPERLDYICGDKPLPSK